ncbi:7964_t:CDS:2 [Funneliformis mosseae]|uniref:7964_t:CDS:1 n=1 Tax=Funneliformis mosseae TaxID=27381 RepID=A0A9N8Z6B3_FUNMO|nr:7964_t:CDS:2 [Funneliformis mosseae]
MINVWLWAKVSDGALIADGKYELLQGIYYVIAQFADALVGSLLIQLIPMQL